MKTSQIGIDLIKQYEGLRLTAYVCAGGKNTIGYGSTIIKGKPVELGSTITLESAKEALREDLERFERGVNDYLRVLLTQNQFDALVSFSYNVGLGNLKSSTLLKKVNANLFQDAAEEFLKWNKSNSKVLPGLIRRREAERNLFLKN